MAFSKREHSFFVLEYARISSVVIVLGANPGNYVHELFLNKTWRVFLSIGVKSTTVYCIMYLLRICKIFHGRKNNSVYY
jgi:hypothetical protein